MSTSYSLHSFRVCLQERCTQQSVESFDAYLRKYFSCQHPLLRQICVTHSSRVNCATCLGYNRTSNSQFVPTLGTKWQWEAIVVSCFNSLDWAIGNRQKWGGMNTSWKSCGIAFIPLIRPDYHNGWRQQTRFPPRSAWSSSAMIYFWVSCAKHPWLS